MFKNTNKQKKADWKDSYKKKQAGVSDMTLLSSVSDASISSNLKARLINGDIYTYIGHVLISVNPFKELDIYNEQIMQSYLGRNRMEKPPHVFAIAETMYHDLINYKENQCVIISGESGAGKTESAKKIMTYISSVSGDSSTDIKNMVLATNPLLESFGCSKTLKNNNSSRHGKYLEIMFENRTPIGANITNYLLEKGRVVQQTKNERNFHIFYQITKSSNKYKDKFGLLDPQNYAYLSQSGCLDVDGIDDVMDYDETLKCMKKIGITEIEKENIHRVLGAILWLGNIQFVEEENSTDNGSQVKDDELLEYTAYVLETDIEDLRKALTTRIMETSRGSRRGSSYEVPLNETQAIATRNALCKFLYEKLFDWIIQRLNNALNLKETNKNYDVIGILDIYGFEIFKNNSFEQLCINYVNEKLQQIFIDLTLKKEQEEYQNENIEWTPISFFNNKIVCDLIEEKRPPGVFSSMNDACATAHADPKAADNTLSQRLQMLTNNPHFEMRGSGFVVKHYAGDVSYNINGMTEKNKDQLNKDLINLTQKSKNDFIKNLFTPENDIFTSKKRPPTASDRIKVSALKLTEKLTLCSPSYIRCIKSNDNKKPLDYDENMCLHQIKYLGLYENVRVRRAGFAFRQTYKGFLERFFLLSKKTSKAGELTWISDPREGTMIILNDANIQKTSYQKGNTKIFIKDPETLFQLEHLREEYWHNKARIIQTYYNKNRNKLKGYLLKQKAQKILNNEKLRRKFSLLANRTFMGNYLNLNNSSPIALSVNISTNEVITFSSKIQKLVSRPLRSSKLMSRLLIITNEKLTLLHNENKSSKGLKIETQASVSDIARISASTLHDDWLIFSFKTQDLDLLICSIFKTEIVTHLLELNNDILFEMKESIQYTKKQNKKQILKFVIDSKIKQDTYKNHTVYVAGEGMPKNSQLITNKLIKSSATKASNTRYSKNVEKKSKLPINNSNTSDNSPIYEAIYDFQCNSEHGMDLIINQKFTITIKNEDGWWYARNIETEKEGWVPSNFLKKSDNGSTNTKLNNLSNKLNNTYNKEPIKIPTKKTQNDPKPVSSIIPSLHSVKKEPKKLPPKVPPKPPKKN